MPEEVIIERTGKSYKNSSTFIWFLTSVIEAQSVSAGGKLAVMREEKLIQPNKEGKLEIFRPYYRNVHSLYARETSVFFDVVIPPYNATDRR